MTEILKTQLSSLYCGDCETVLSEILEMGGRYDKIITSPPYNIRRDLDDVKYDVWKDGMPNDDYIDWIVRLFCLFDEAMNKDGCILWNMNYGGENNNRTPCR